VEDLRSLFYRFQTTHVLYKSQDFLAESMQAVPKMENTFIHKPSVNVVSGARFEALFMLLFSKKSVLNSQIFK